MSSLGYPQKNSFFYRNGLSIVVLLFMLATWVGQIITGRLVYNEELIQLGAPALSLWAYLDSCLLYTSRCV